MTPATAEKHKLSRELETNLARLDKLMAIDENFDIIKRELVIGGKKVALIFVDGLTNDEIITMILRNLVELGPRELTIDTFNRLFNHHLNYVEVDPVEYLEDITHKVLAGPVAMLVDGSDKAIMIDVRTYPARSPAEPDLEKVVRGSRDGFTETLVYNTALIRRRIRDPKLRMVYAQVGNRSKTDIIISYIEDIANPDLVNSIKEKIKHIKIDGLPMAEKAVEELITPGSYWNPFPRVRYTERPDVSAMHLLEGHVLVLVDTSPSVIIAPSTFWHHLQHAEEYRQSPMVGAYLRWIRFAGIAISLLLLPLWLLFALHPGLLPPALAFIGPEEVGRVPLIVQFLIAELAIDMVRMSTIHTPSPLATGIGLIAALLIGDIAITVGLFAPEVVMYIAAAAIGTFLTPSYELSLAIRLVRIVLLVLVAAFSWVGMLVGFGGFIVFLVSMRSFGVPYLWPLIPFNFKALLSVLIRAPVPITNTRPQILHPQDVDRQVVAGAARKPLRQDRGRKRK
jgi:stage V sporulation protein AF